LATTHVEQDVHLIYYNQATKPLFASEWIELQKQMPNLKVSLIDTAQEGMITGDQLADTCTDFKQRLAYLCGPLGMITTSRDLLLEAGIKDEDVHHELFGPKPINPALKNQAANIYFSQSGKQVKVDAGQTKSLLELAEASNTNPTSGCRMGVCHQCKCHKQQGVVYNTLTESYSDTGAEDIQLCVSVAVGDVTLEL
jgi:ferredoxin-NADP reductase